MLLELRVKNFAIINEQTMTFSSGLNVISGETGAGKSLILQALQLILGARAKSRFLKQGSEGWEVEALFSLERLSEQSISELPEIARTEELVVTRSMSQNGRGRVYINGRLGTLALLEEITNKLMNICSQNHQIRLLDSSYQLNLIDGYAQSAGSLKKYQEVFYRWLHLRNQIEEGQKKVQENVLREAELRNVYEELSGLAPFEGVRESLEDQIARLTNSEVLIEKCNAILSELNSEQGLFSRLFSVESDFKNVLELDPTIAALLPIIQSSSVELEEFEREFSSYANSLDVDEERLESLRTQLAEYAHIERKYRRGGKELDELFASVQSELSSLHLSQNTEQLKEEFGVAEEALGLAAKELQEKRSKAAKKLGKLVEDELSELNMPGAKFVPNFQPCGFSSHGDHRVEFMIELNQGSGLKALKEIASGGELSRIMLVLKKILRDRSGVNVLIFDEVDSGISGSVARAVGEKLKSLSSDSQVLCITHLAQVASLADSHLMVRKELVNSVTHSVVEVLNEEQRLEEISRMLAGYEITPAIRESARELLSS